MKKKSLTLPILALTTVLVSCGSKPIIPDHAVIDPTKSSFEVGILLPLTVSALEDAANGFRAALNEAKATSLQGKTINYTEYNAEGDASSHIAYAKSLVGKCDLLLGVSTGSSKNLKNARDEAGKKQPLLFTAVTDPVGDGLMRSLTNHDGSVTGTSDDNPVEAQVNLIVSCFEGKKTADQIKLGVIYTSDEHNSEVQSDRATATARSLGLSSATVYTVDGTIDLAAQARKACSENDVIYIPTDNNIAGHMDSIKQATDLYHTLCIVGESGMLQTGGHITYSIDYTLLGRRTGEMAADILSGNKLTENIDAEKMTEDKYLNKFYSSTNLLASGISLSEDLLDDFTDINA